ncbi:MAG: Rieske (2Fe-2S) protein [Halobacteriales archaeon]|nr:Rieske (2Fe-2S) protein [Halobacteriales archaeon]
MADHRVVGADDLGDGERVTVQLEGREITVFHLDGEYYAYTNWCPHQSGPACEGQLSGTWDARVDPETHEVELEWSREAEILNCPWHGWEYDVTTGDCLSRPGVRLPTHDVRVEDGEVVVSL